MKVIQNKIIPFGRRFHAINLFGTVFAKGECNPVMLNHEAIHTAQMRELAFAGFYVLYVLEWLVRIFINRGFMNAYRNISFECEAYANQSDMAYLNDRPRYAWRRYLHKKRGRR